MYCNHCGKGIQEDANVCAYCGSPVGYRAVQKRLKRPRAGRKIAGVCAGFADYFDVDPTLIRLIWLVIVIFGGTGLLAYVIGWIVMPEQPQIVMAPMPEASSGYPVASH